MNGWILASAVILVLGLTAFMTHVLLTQIEKRGWVYYRSTDKPRPRSLGLLEEIYQPSMTHVIDQETLEESVKHQSESGDPDKPGHED
jgi:uncharacterized membrane protein